MPIPQATAPFTGLNLIFQFQETSQPPSSWDLITDPFQNFASSDSLQGEAPQISQVYGEYDNGRVIFPFYCNFTGNSYTVGIYWNNSLQYWYLNGNTIYILHNSSVEYGAYYPSAGMASGGNGAGILKIQYIRGRYLPPDNVMPEITGEYVVTDFGSVTFTASGIPSQATWYLNISNYPVLEHTGTLSSCVQLPAGYYYYNVSSYYQGSKFAAAGTFTVSGNAKTYVLIVFVQRIVNLPPHRNSILLPPEIYLIIFEILILITGFGLILASKRKSNSD